MPKSFECCATVFPKSRGEQQSYCAQQLVNRKTSKPTCSPISFIQQRKSQILTWFMNGILEWGAQLHFTWKLTKSVVSTNMSGHKFHSFHLFVCNVQMCLLCWHSVIHAVFLLIEKNCEILTWKTWFRPMQRIFHGKKWPKFARFGTIYIIFNS